MVVREAVFLLWQHMEWTISWGGFVVEPEFAWSTYLHLLVVTIYTWNLERLTQLYRYTSINREAVICSCGYVNPSHLSGASSPTLHLSGASSPALRLSGASSPTMLQPHNACTRRLRMHSYIDSGMQLANFSVHTRSLVLRLVI